MRFARMKRPLSSGKAPIVNEFPHAMLREIFEQPEAIQRTLDFIWMADGLEAGAFAPMEQWLNSRGEVLIAASGSSRHAGLAAEIIFEDLCGLAVDVEYSSEYSCRPAVNPRTAVGAGDLAVGRDFGYAGGLRFAKEGRQQTLAIANVPGSTMLREAGAAMPLAAGKELAIPATKSFTCQLTALYLLALYEGSWLGRSTKHSINACSPSCEGYCRRRSSGSSRAGAKG